MNPALLRGNLVRLAADEPEVIGKAFARWERDTEYQRLLHTDPAALWSEKKFKEWLEKDLSKETQEEFFFDIHTLEGDRLVGFIGLMDIEWNHGNAWVAIGIGDRAEWGKGYGSEAMRLIVQYAFNELNLQRVSLAVFEYNQRAQRSYEKVGFKLEGRQRQVIHRAGQRYDVLIMGILRSDWYKTNPPVV